MFHTKLNGLFLRDDSTVHDKPRDKTFYTLAEDTIFAVQQPRRAIVPMQEFLGSVEYIDAAVQERLCCLLGAEAAAVLDRTPALMFDNVVQYMKIRLRDVGGLAAIVGNRAVLEALDGVSDVPLYLAPVRMHASIAFGLPLPEHTGRIVQTDEKSWSPLHVTRRLGLVSFGVSVPVQIYGVSDVADKSVPENPRPAQSEALLKTA